MAATEEYDGCGIDDYPSHSGWASHDEWLGSIASHENGPMGCADSHAKEPVAGVLAKLGGMFTRIFREIRFYELSTEWKDETGCLSNISSRSIHPAYQMIIGMGEGAVPLILRDLSRNGPDDWFWALTAITGENPIFDEIAGNMTAMTEVWLQWGKKMGYLKNFPRND